MPSKPGVVPPRVARISAWSWSFVGAVLAVGIVVFALAAVREVVIPLVLSAFLAVVFAPAVDWLNRRRIPRGIGAAIVILAIAASVAIVIGAVVVGIVDQADNLRSRFDEIVAQVDDLVGRSDLTEFVDSVLSGAEGSGSLLRGGIGDTVGTVVGTATGFASGLVLGAVLLYYLLKDGSTLAQGALDRLDDDRRERCQRVLTDAAATVRAYIKGRTTLALVQGTVIGLAAVLLGVPLAFAIAVVNVFGAYIPYLGGFIGGAFAVLMAVSEGGATLAIIVLVIVVAVSVGLENLLEPVLLGNQLRLHPIAVLLATIIGGLLVGITGMLLGAPALAIGRAAVGELQLVGRPDAEP